MQAASHNARSSKYVNKNQETYSGKNKNVIKSKRSMEDSQHTCQNVGRESIEKDVIDDLPEQIKFKEDKIEQQENYNKQTNELNRRAGKEQENVTKPIHWKGKSTGRSRPLKDTLSGDGVIKMSDCSSDESQPSKGLGEVNAVINTDVQEKLEEKEEIIQDLQKNLSSVEAQIKDLLRRNTLLEQRVADEIWSCASYDQRSNGGNSREDQRKRNSSKKDQKRFNMESYANGLQNVLAEKNEEIEKLQKTENELKAKILELGCRMTDLERKAIDDQRRLNKITQQLESKLECGECFENINDVFSVSNIARRLQTLYDDDWVKLSRLLGNEVPNLSEFERVKLISPLLQRSYEECRLLAERQLREFLFLEDTEQVPDQQEEIIRLRKQYYFKESVRQNVTKKVFEILKSTEDVQRLIKDEIIQKVSVKVDEFYHKFIVCCWAIAVSHPPVILNFNVVGKPYEDCKECFKEFSVKKPVDDFSREEGTIAVVVWPSMESRNEPMKCYNKGDVIVVKKQKSY